MFFKVELSQLKLLSSKITLSLIPTYKQGRKRPCAFIDQNGIL